MNDARHRLAGRAIIRSDDGHVLMIRGEDPADPGRGGFWFTPGGGLDEGESVDDAIRRELMEETGLDVEIIGPVVLRRWARVPLVGEMWTQDETVVLIAVDTAFDPQPAGLEELEASVITEYRWFTADELRAIEEDVYPRCLVDLLDEIEAAGPPVEPWIEDLRGSTPRGE